LGALRLDENYDYHLARLLILLNTISGKKLKTVSGITKLVKLDFLLRYPTVLALALKKSGELSQDVQIEEHEKRNVESKMIRFKYGPWDHRYRLFLAVLEGKGLITIHHINDTPEIQITEAGRSAAVKLSEMDEFSDYTSRSEIIKNIYADYAGTTLARKIYEWLPELSAMQYGEVIPP
jgi:hypothetical protein